VANSQDASSSQHPDLLAAVVLHTLVSEGREGMSAARVAIACQRDPNVPGDIDEIVTALEILLEDGLAERETGPPPQPLYRPTCAAIRAAELSF
jgi:hypothetical protein